MTRRRRAWHRRYPLPMLAAVGLGGLVVLAALLVVLHWAGYLLITAGLVAAAYVVGRRHGGAPAQPAAVRGSVIRPAAAQAAPVPAPRRGSKHLPPVRGGVVSVCSECAAGSCVWCSDTRCSHRTSGHPNLPRPAAAPAPVPSGADDETPPF